MVRVLFLTGVLVLLTAVPVWAAADCKAATDAAKADRETTTDTARVQRDSAGTVEREDVGRTERVARHWGDLRTTSDPGGTKVGQNSFNLSEYMQLSRKDRILYEQHFQDRPIPQHNATNGLRQPWMQAHDDGRIWHWADERMRAYDPIASQYATPNFRPLSGLG